MFEHLYAAPTHETRRDRADLEARHG